VEGRRAWPTTSLSRRAARPGWRRLEVSLQPITLGTAALPCGSVLCWRGVRGARPLGSRGIRDPASTGQDGDISRRRIGGAARPESDATNRSLVLLGGGAGAGGEGGMASDASRRLQHIHPPTSARLFSPSYTLRATVGGKGAVDDPGVIFGPGDALFWPAPPVEVAHLSTGLAVCPGSARRAQGDRTTPSRRWATAVAWCPVASCHPAAPKAG
jgi:hypothetical protein